LFGYSFLYGLTGTLNLLDLGLFFSQIECNVSIIYFAIIASLLILVAFLFKLYIVFFLLLISYFYLFVLSMIFFFFCIIIYLFLFIINFIFIFLIFLNLYLSKNKFFLERLFLLSGLLSRNKILAFCLIIFFFTAAGIPPFSLFFAKVLLLTGVSYNV